MILITSTGELILYFTVIFFSFDIKKNVVAGLFFLSLLLLQESIFSGSKILKASSSGSVGKLTVIKWNT